MKQRQYPDLQIDEDLRQARLEWKLQRGAWGLFYLLLLAAFVGAMGEGPVSHKVLKESGTGSAFELHYERFLRQRAEDRLRLSFDPVAGSSEVWIGGEYLRSVHLEGISPEPEQMRLEADGTVFVFATSASNAVHATFHIRALRPGWLHGLVAVNRGAPHAFKQWVYP